jgi:ribosomal subunit interface protein
MGMLTYKITGDDVQINAEDRAYIEKRFARFERFTKGEHHKEVTVVVRRMVAHERGHAFKVEVTFNPSGQDYFVSSEQKDVRIAVDAVNNELWRQITAEKGREQSLFHRGARKFKNMLKGNFGKNE